VEYSEKPLGVDAAAPRFSWKMSAPEDVRGYFQTAYRILVTDPGGGVMWDSEKTESDISLGIQYAGMPLEAATRYDWTVTVWDQTGVPASESSWFETGLMADDDASDAWEGARWIGGGGEDLVLFSHYLSVFKLQYTLQLDNASGSSRAGFVYGANDARLMDRDKNIFNIESGEDESFIRIDLDTRPMDEAGGNPAELRIYRAGYHLDDDPKIPLKRIEISSDIINLKNRYDSHTVCVESVFGTTRIYLDGTDEAHEITRGEGLSMGPFSTPGINLNPVGSGGDYISFPMLADIGFAVPAGQAARFSNIRVRHYRSPSNVLFEAGTAASEEQGDGDVFMAAAHNGDVAVSREEAGYMVDGGRSGALVTADPSRNAMPMLRTQFDLGEKKIENARLYVTARGIYEVYINGSRVGEDWFNPGLTQYNVTHMYQTYDVTDLLQTGGENVLGAQLGEGWWSGNITFTGGNWNYFGDRQSLLAKLVVSYDDGTRAVVTTGEDGWKYFEDGPVRYGSFFQGEVYDATREAAVAGWCEPGFDDAAWKPAVLVPLEGTAYTGTSTGMDGVASDFNYDRFSLVGQVGENARVVETLTAKSMEAVRPGIYVYDMGQNMVGVPRIQIDGSPGQQVTLRYAETLYPDLPEYGENIGMVMLENIRAALAQDIHILKGGAEVLQPRFTFHGYRYLEITGVDTPPAPEAVQGLVVSSVEGLTADYDSSNPKVNQLWENIVWSMRGNFLSIPTDCPQRNERMGWSGDLSVFSRSATYLSDVEQFLTRHMTAMRDVQRSDGRFTDVAPLGGGFGGILWGSAGVTVAWEAYQQYGDLQLLRDHYAAMKQYVDYLETSIDPETGVMSEGPLGDWLSPEGDKNDSPLLWCAYYVYDLDILAQVAEILGEAEDAETFRRQYRLRKEHFNDTFVDPETGRTITSDFVSAGFGPLPEDTGETGGKMVDTQTSYAVPLALGVFSEENVPAAARHLADACGRENKDDDGAARPPYSLMTGFIGTAWISRALSENGYPDIAYRLLQQETYPSWLYPVDQGATTIWERLNSYTVEAGFGGNNSMNSFNHYSFGAVGQWLMANSLGIARDEESPGFKHFILKPEPDPTGEMTFAEGRYDSVYGRIQSGWTLGGGMLTYTAVVPANTIATLYLPGAAGDITEGDFPAGDARGVTFIKEAAGRSIYRLASGTYRFHVPQ
jgi:alpha-L-rhamnosidase